MHYSKCRMTIIFIFKQTQIMEDFKIRSYTKKELALMYFPDSNPRTAANHLRAWIYRCKPLLEQLEAAGYKRISKMFTPRQVRLIVEHLGEP